MRTPAGRVDPRLEGFWYVGRVGDAGVAGETYEVVCPHCNKEFSAELLQGSPHRQGFKCPHCRLFVPYERAAEQPQD